MIRPLTHDDYSLDELAEVGLGVPMPAATNPLSQGSDDRFSECVPATMSETWRLLVIVALITLIDILIAVSVLRGWD